ncbi:MAG: leucyl aminopeptidase [Proteobacteria bacterium]|nr:leucyl aminopeptidase [Pseudomonadota bacterium]
MEYGTKVGNPVKTRTQCIVVGVYENNQLSDTATLLDKASKGHIRKILKRGDIQGKTNQTLLLHDVPNINSPRVLLVGLGSFDTADSQRFLSTMHTVIAKIKQISAKNTLCCLLETKADEKGLAWKVSRMIEQFEAGLYSYTEMKGKPSKSDHTNEVIDFQLTDKNDQREVSAAIAQASALTAGIAAAKDVANTPANVCTPTYLATVAKQLAKDYSSITTTILDEKDMQKLGMGAFLSVSQGSEEPAKLIVMKHKGAKPKDKPHVIIGKGITFDSGGISLKPGGTMYEMIYDMCGAASVLGTMKAIAGQQLPMNVVGVIAAAENMPSGSASRPGDIVKTMSGQTVEILNTDAEGRLVLCDALTYVDKFNPATVIDIATLTGACVVALGSHATGLFSNDDAVANNLIEAGEDTLDRVWRMPIWEEYQSQIKSAFADMQNIGGREAGSITAACFLARYTKKYRWAHLDIAGTAYKWVGLNKGATGRPVALLTQYLNDRATET